MANAPIISGTRDYTIYVSGEQNQCLFWIRPNGEAFVADNVDDAARVFVDAVAPLIRQVAQASSLCTCAASRVLHETGCPAAHQTREGEK